MTKKVLALQPVAVRGQETLNAIQNGLSGLERVSWLLQAGFTGEARKAFRTLSTEASPRSIMLAIEPDEQTWTLLSVRPGLLEAGDRVWSCPAREIMDPLRLFEKEEWRAFMRICLEELLQASESPKNEGRWAAIFQRRIKGQAATMIALARELRRVLPPEDLARVARSVLSVTVRSSSVDEVASHIDEWMDGAPILPWEQRVPSGSFEALCSRHKLAPADLLENLLRRVMADLRTRTVIEVVEFIGDTCDWSETRNEVVRRAFFQESARGFWEALLDRTLGFVDAQPDGLMKDLNDLETLFSLLADHPLSWHEEPSEGVTLFPGQLAGQYLKKVTRLLVEQGHTRSAFILFARFHRLFLQPRRDHVATHVLVDDYAAVLREALTSVRGTSYSGTELRIIDALLEIIRESRYPISAIGRMEERELVARRKLLRELHRFTKRSVFPPELPWSPLAMQLQGPRLGR